MKHWWEKTWWVLGILLLAGFLVYGYWPKPILVETATVERSPLIVTVDDDGETRIRERYAIAAPVTGKLLRLSLHPGDSVVRDKTELLQLLPVDPSLLDARSRAESQARVRSAEAALEESTAALSNATEVAALAQHEYDRAVALHKSKSIPQAEFDEAEHQRMMALAGVRAAELRKKIKLHELEMARTAVASFTASNEDAHDPMRIKSPIDGHVLRVLHEDSSVVPAGTTILEIGDPREMEIQIDVLSNYAVGIEPGARVFIEHWGGKQPLHGIVRVVEPSAFLKISALGVEEKRVKVIADFVEPWEERKTLGDGFRVEARIVTHTTSPDSLKVSTGTLFRHGDSWHVFQLRNSRAALTPVTIGASNGRETEVVRGLKEGDIVVLHPSEQIRDGIQVLDKDRK